MHNQNKNEHENPTTTTASPGVIWSDGEPSGRRALSSIFNISGGTVCAWRIWPRRSAAVRYRKTTRANSTTRGRGKGRRVALRVALRVSQGTALFFFYSFIFLGGLLLAIPAAAYAAATGADIDARANAMSGEVD
jgi:hypothetical protein